MLTAAHKIEKTNKESLPRAIELGGSSIPFSVCLVDDDIIFLRSLEHHLQHKLSRNIKITSFQNGEEFIKNLHQKPDMVILDYILNSQYPKAMNGVAVLKKIKQIYPETIAIMVSGQDNMQVAIDTMKYGAYDYVIKNENAFLRVQNTVKNAIHSILLDRELKNYKRWTKVVLSIIAVAIITALIIQVFFPQYFHLNE